MNERYIRYKKENPKESNIYANKSALILTWLLTRGQTLKSFSLREAGREIDVSLGLIQKIFSHLAQDGLLETRGVRTAKNFSFKKPKKLLDNWLEFYDITKKCRMWTYETAFPSKSALLERLSSSRFAKISALALHSAAEAYGCKNTNLNTLELYIEDEDRSDLEALLELEPKERGYDVLLIKPYYKSLLVKDFCSDFRVSSPLLTYLDLFHFPLRGPEQAEFIEGRIPELRQIFSWRKP